MFLFFLNSTEWKCFSLRTKYPNLHKDVFFFSLEREREVFFLNVCFEASVLFCLCVWKRKRVKAKTPAGLEEAVLRNPLWRDSPYFLSGSVHLAVAPRGEELISQTEEEDFISRWISDRPFSNDRLCTTCLSSPCRTPFGTSSPPHGVSWLLVLI